MVDSSFTSKPMPSVTLLQTTIVAADPSKTRVRYEIAEAPLAEVLRHAQGCWMRGTDKGKLIF